VPICVSGVSQRKAGVPRYVILTRGVIGDLLQAVAPWLVPFTTASYDIALDLDVFCASDPPTFDSWTSAFLLALGTVGGTRGQVIEAVAQMSQWATGIGWYQWCECADATPTPLPTLPSPPADVPTFDPPITPPSTTFLGSILANSPTHFWRLADAEYGRLVSIGSEFIDLVPWAPTGNVLGFTGPASDGGSMLLVSLGPNAPLTTPNQWTMEVWVWIAWQFVAEAVLFSIPLSSGHSADVRAAGTQFKFQFTGGTAVTGGTVARGAWQHVAAVMRSGSTELYVNGSSVGTSGSAHTGGGGYLFVGPANAALQLGAWFAEAVFFPSALSAAQILAHYNAADNKTMRPAVKVFPDTRLPVVGLALPTLPSSSSVIDGTAFTGLTGDGEVALDGDTIGVRVDVTTVPGRIGEENGTPVTLFDVGRIAWGDAVAFETSERVASGSWRSFPSEPQLSTRIGYTFTADVVATITCLVAV
jgi:hypothetical protein